MKLKTEKLLIALNVLAWIAFIGLLIKAGAIVISYLVSIGNVVASKDLYKGMDQSAYRELGFMHYSIVTWYIVALYIMQAYVAFLMTRLLSRLNISRPFNPDVVNLMQKISYTILSVWVVAMVYNLHIAILERVYGINATYMSGEFIFLAGIVYVLAQMFKRGVEIQSENTLTI